VKPIFIIALVVLICSCGMGEDIKAAKEKYYDADYKRGYDWAKSQGYIDDNQCARFITLAGESASLQGCLDYYFEYKRKAKEFSGESDDDNEPEAAPAAPPPIEDHPANQESISDWN